MKVSIKEISKITGYSPATVSNALNGRRKVSEKAQIEINKVAEMLRSDQEERTSRIRFVTYRTNGDILDESHIFPSMIEGAERRAKALGYEMTYSHLDRESRAFETNLKNVLDDESSFIILLGTEMLEDDYEPFKRIRNRIVVLDGWCEDMCFNGVMINNTDAAYNAVNYLINSGHTKIGYLQGKYRIKAFEYRECGYERALGRKNIPIIAGHIVTLGTRLESAYEDMRRYLDTIDDLPTAFFADNDIIAIGALRAIAERGMRIPEDISVVGFDDIFYSKTAVPGLTTVRVNQKEMGEEAVLKIVEESKQDSDIVQKTQIWTELVERGSVKKIRQ